MTPHYWRKRESWVSRHQDATMVIVFLIFFGLAIAGILYLANRP